MANEGGKKEKRTRESRSVKNCASFSTKVQTGKFSKSTISNRSDSPQSNNWASLDTILPPILSNSNFCNAKLRWRNYWLSGGQIINTRSKKVDKLLTLEDVYIYIYIYML